MTDEVKHVYHVSVTAQTIVDVVNDKPLTLEQITERAADQVAAMVNDQDDWAWLAWDVDTGGEVLDRIYGAVMRGNSRADQLQEIYEILNESGRIVP